jgi:peptidoglycan/xylan/chitin deacetylase (PgdA/CDA1 family)
MYHRVTAEPDAITGEVDARLFDLQMRALREYFSVLPLSEAVSRLQQGSLPARAVSITFDDGYADNHDVALPILRRHGLSATFFVANGFLNGGRMFNDTVIEAIRRASGGTIDIESAGLRGIRVGSIAEKRAAVAQVLRAVKYLDPDQRDRAAAEVASLADSRLPDDLMMNDSEVRALANNGMEIGGHTVSHPILTRIDAERARQEIFANRLALGQITGSEPRLFAYPNGVPGEDYALEHVAIVRETGYRAAVSTSWGAANRETSLFELPRFTPWDRDPVRFAVRLLHNMVARRPTVLSAASSKGPRVEAVSA